MAVVSAFGAISGTENAGLCAYFRATACTEVTIADVLPMLSKITQYEQEYVVGELKIWNTGIESASPNNCAMVRVIVYNDGWMVAWFDKESHTQFAGSAFAFVGAYVLSGFGSEIQYPDQWNSCYLKIINSNGAGTSDPECPDGTIFTIHDSDSVTGQIEVVRDYSSNLYHFNTGNTYDAEVYMSNGNLVWWGNVQASTVLPPNLSNTLYRAIYEMWENIRYSSNTTSATDAAASAAMLDDGGAFTDLSTQFNNSVTNDCPLLPADEVVGDAFYYGSSNKFNGLNLDVGTVGAGDTILWEYWDGSTWASLVTVDATNGFTVAGSNTVTFTPPDAWSKCFVNSSEHFWIRSRVSAAAYTAQPILTQGWVIVPDALEYSNVALGMYSFEYPAANYCLVCGSSGSNEQMYFYSTVLPGKTIYNHVINWGTNAGTVRIYVNDAEIVNNSSTSTYGYANTNMENIDADAGIQNVFSLYTNNYTAKLAAVLITG